MRAFAHYRGREPYDVEKYTELLLRAVETVLTPLGVTHSQIDQWVKERTGEVERIAIVLPNKTKTYWGPLFEFAERDRSKDQAFVQE